MERMFVSRPGRHRRQKLDANTDHHPLTSISGFMSRAVAKRCSLTYTMQVSIQASMPKTSPYTPNERGTYLVREIATLVAASLRLPSHQTQLMLRLCRQIAQLSLYNLLRAMEMTWHLLNYLHVRFHPALPGPSFSSSSFAVDDICLRYVHHVAFEMPIYSVAFLCYVCLVVDDSFFSCSSSLAAHIFVDVLDVIRLQLERANDGGTEVTERTRNSRITRDHIVYGNCYEMRSVRFA